MKSARFHHRVSVLPGSAGWAGALVSKQHKLSGIDLMHLAMCMCMKEMPVAGAPEVSL